ncbi:DUF551 domain-containing protein [Escherichia coli]|uniref:DUF551 domain-containing protein n=1 Tax=Escherichia coli TaxID=562 RepID=UPI0034641EB6
MTPLTDKKQYPSEQYLNELITNIEFAARAPVEVVRAMAAELQKRREADSAEPVAYIFKHPAGKLFWALTDESNKDQSDVIPVYAAPPVPVVPAALPENDDEDGHDIDYLEPSGVYALGRTAGWNACRAAMLQGKSEQPQNAQQNIPENIPGGNSPVTPDGWISCSERMPVIGELNWRTSFPLLVTCEIGVIPAYYGFVRVNGNKHYGFMESLKYGDDSGNHPQTNEYDLISNVTHWMPLPEPPQEVK